MKRLAVILAAAVAAAVLGYLLVGLRHGATAVALEGARGADLAWIRAEFAISDEQFVAVQALHDAYAGQCAQHCADIVAARTHRDALRSAAGTPAELREAERRIVTLEAVCNDATRAHLRRVAGAMPAAEGERFLRTVEPHLAQIPHDGGRRLSP